MKRIVIPVVVGSSPIVHPNKFNSSQLLIVSENLSGSKACNKRLFV